MLDITHLTRLVTIGVHQNPVLTTYKILKGPRVGLILAKEEYWKAINSAIFPGIPGEPFERLNLFKKSAFE